MNGIVTVTTRKWIYKIPFREVRVEQNPDPDNVPQCGYAVEIAGFHKGDPIIEELDEHEHKWQQIKMNLGDVAERELRGDGG